MSGRVDIRSPAYPPGKLALGFDEVASPAKDRVDQQICLAREKKVDDDLFTSFDLMDGQDEAAVAHGS